MSKPLRVLVVEDSEDDALLVIRELQRGGYEPVFKRVETRETMSEALDKEKWDAIISDFRMPHFDAFEALRLMQEKKMDLPFIIVSGTIGEDIAVQCMKAGAQDFFVKGNLTRLCAAVERELAEAKMRLERRLVQAELDKQKELAQKYLDIAGVIIIVVNADGNISLINQRGAEILGYDKEEIIGKNWFDNFIPQDIRDDVKTVSHRLISEENGLFGYYENLILTKSGAQRLIAWNNTVIRDDSGRVIATLSSGEDITERKKMEEETKRHMHELEVFYKANIGREERILELKEEIRKLKKELGK